MQSQLVPETAYRAESIGEDRDRHILLSGCSGGGKSSLLAELAARGFATFAEAGRQIIKEQRLIGADMTPGSDLLRFVDLTVSRAVHHRILGAAIGGVCFYDRGVIDQVGALERRGTAVPPHLAQAARLCRYNRVIFLVPPWRAIYLTDRERRHGFDEAVADYQGLIDAYERRGYTPVILPRCSIAERADLVLSHLNTATADHSSP